MYKAIIKIKPNGMWQSKIIAEIKMLAYNSKRTPAETIIMGNNSWKEGDLGVRLS